MTRALWAVLVGLSTVGCGSSVCAAGNLSLSDPPQGPPLSGQQASVLLHLDASGTCGGAKDFQVKAVLHDPAGTEVPVQVSLQALGSGSTQQVDATLSFTPMSGGNYHLDATVTPGNQTLSRDFLVIAGATDATQVAATVPQNCTTLARTAKGAYLCDGVVYRSGTAGETVDGVVAVAGDSIWAYANGTLRALQDPGSGALVELGSIAAGDGGTALLAASANDAYLAWDTQVQRFVSSDAGVTAAGAMSVAFGPDAGVARALSSGSGYALVAADAPDAGSYVCEVDASGTALTAGACLTSFHALLGGDARGIWLSDPAKITTQRSPPTQIDGFANLYRVTGGTGPTLRGSVVFPDGLQALSQGGAVWVKSALYGLTLLPEQTDAALYLQQFVPSTQEPVVGVSDELVWTQPSGYTRTAAFVRP